MSGDTSNNNGAGNGRRASVTSAAFSNLFQRTNSTSAGSGQSRESAMAANARDQHRRLSVTTLGLGTTPPAATSPFGLRRGSISTATSESIDENAVDDEDSAKPPNAPFNRRMSFGTQTVRTMRGAPPTSPGQNDNAFNWSEQLRSRAESSVTGARPNFGGSISGSPPRAPAAHDRAKSVSEMPAPPQQAPTARPQQLERPKPDHMQERILKGDFYMD